MNNSFELFSIGSLQASDCLIEFLV